MNRNQAEHILDAYLELASGKKHEAAANALRDVILDAMTSSAPNYYTIPSITYKPTENTPLKWTCTSGTACINGEES